MPLIIQTFFLGGNHVVQHPILVQKAYRSSSLAKTGKLLSINALIAAGTAPVCVDASISTLQGATYSSTPLCTDAEGDALTYTIVDPPAHGTANSNTATISSKWKSSRH